MNYLPSLILSAVLLSEGCNPPVTARSGERPAASNQLPECEWCGAPEAPASLSSSMTIIPTDRGERLLIEGTIYEPDGRTPASGILLYAYHTNEEGIYPKRSGESENGRRHGYLRGWLRTGSDGKYLITTTKPGSYPSGGAPAHVHMTVERNGGSEQYIDDVVFEGDPFLTPEHRARLRKRGGSGIVELRPDDEGGFRVTRDIVLEKGL